MLRTCDWKLVSRVNGRDELYDLRSDPHETRNLFGQPDTGSVVDALRSKQLLWLMQTADIVPFDYDTRMSEEMVWAKLKRMVPPDFEAEIRAKIADGINPYLLIQQCRQRFVANR